MNFFLRFSAGLVALTGLGIAGFQATRVAYADWYARQPTREALERSLAAMPEDAGAHLRLALLLRDEDGAAAEIHFRVAIEQNRWDSRSLIEWALLAETRGDYDRAENLLLSAARVDALYFPRWSLANYYLRRGDHANFWKWARSAAAIPSGSLHALYRLAAYMADDTESIVGRLGLNRSDTLRDYLVFATSTGRLSELKEVAGQLHRPEDRKTIFRACDVLIRAGRSNDAAQICPASGELWHSRDDGGFEWRVSRVKGVQATFLENPKALRLHLTANQPERCELLWRYLPESSAREIAVSSGFYTRGLPPESGLHWELSDAVTGKPVGKLQKFLFSDRWTTSRESVGIAEETQGLRLSLIYQRALGTVRTEGDLYLQSVEVTGEGQ